jgi:CrcB protein
MRPLLAVGIGGFLGACLRFGITRMLVQYQSFPFATLVSNVIAGLCIGVVIGVERETSHLPAHAKLFLTTGFLGGLSTFSTFSLETVMLLEGGHWWKAGANTLLNVGLSFAGVFAGFVMVKMIKRLV